MTARLHRRWWALKRDARRTLDAALELHDRALLDESQRLTREGAAAYHRWCRACDDGRRRREARLPRKPPPSDEDDVPF